MCIHIYIYITYMCIHIYIYIYYIYVYIYKHMRPHTWDVCGCLQTLAVIRQDTGTDIQHDEKMDGCPTARNFQTENIKFARSFKDHQGSLIPNPPSCIAKYISFNDFWLVYAPIDGKQNEEFNWNKHQNGILTKSMRNAFGYGSISIDTM